MTAMPMHHLLVSLRNAYEAHDNILFMDLLTRVNAKLQAAEVPVTQLAACARGPACVCTTFEKRSSCTYFPAPRSL